MVSDRRYTGPGNIKHLCFGPPCKDHSKLRLITPKGKPDLNVIIKFYEHSSLANNRHLSRAIPALIPVHVDTKVNLADIFTKLLPAVDFERLRSLIMYELIDGN